MDRRATGPGLDEAKPDRPWRRPGPAGAARAPLEPQAWGTYLARRAALGAFLARELSPALLRRHRARLELLRKCSFHLELLPRPPAPGAAPRPVDPRRFQRMKRAGAAQSRIQLLLLGHLLEQLDRGRAELGALLAAADPRPFLAGWARLERRLGDLAAAVDGFLAAGAPGRLHVRHRLVAAAGAAKAPLVRLALRARTPVLFDRRGSEAHRDWVSLRWAAAAPPPAAAARPPAAPERFELRFRLLGARTRQERAQCGIVPVAARGCALRNLLPGRAYRFSVRRAASPSLVLEPWRDSLTLRTKPGPAAPPGPRRP